MSRTLLTAILLCVLARPALPSIEIRVTSDTAGEIQCIPAPVNGQIVTMHVVLSGSDALSSASFQINIPPRLIYLQDHPVFAQTTGVSVLGATVTFDACLPPPVHVLSIDCLVYENDRFSPCQFVHAGEVLAMDCAAEPVPATSTYSRVPLGTCVITGPSDPSPADLAENVPLDAVLEWTATAATGGCALGEYELYQDLFFGTTPDPPRIMQGYAYSPFDPGELQPGTRYYWRVHAFQYWGNPVDGPLWMFRTAGTVATNATTWGRIKALYRK
jgi:hypothetical protein